MLAAVLLATASVTACGMFVTRTVVVPVGSSLILLEPVPLEGKKILIKDENGEWIEGEGDVLPAGYACTWSSAEDFEGR